MAEGRIETFEDSDATRVWRRGGKAVSQNVVADPDQDDADPGDGDTTDSDTTDNTDGS